MNSAHIWAITTKEISIFIKKKSIIISTLIAPFFIAIGVPILIWYLYNLSPAPWSEVVFIFDAFSFLFVILAALIPTVISAYSFVGEKIEKSLEPLLATPTTDEEILLGKILAAFLPTVCINYISFVIYMILIDDLSYTGLGYLYYPNWSMAATFFPLIPLASILSIEVSIIISAKVNDIRTAENLSALGLMPFILLYLLSEIDIISLTPSNLLILAGIIGIVDLLLYFLSHSVFEREEILTKWK